MWFYLALAVLLYFVIRSYRERQQVDNLREKYVFITGCDSGFGNQLARQLDAQGLRVLAACLTQTGAQQLERLTSNRLKTTLLDVTSTESIEAATVWVKECVGNKGLWGLVNNAGLVYPFGPNEWLTKEDYMKVLNVNLIGLIDVTLHMLPLVKKARGRVVNMSSIMGRLSTMGGGYSISKYGVEAFSDSLRREMHSIGVKIAIIEPGYFRTSMTDTQKNLDVLEQQWMKVPEQIKESYGQAYFDAFYKGVKDNLATRCCKDLYLVTDCIEHALISQYPRTRYSAGWDSRWIFIPLSYLPTFITDFVLTRSWPKPAQAL
ncbi:PREDICTED: 17-beta-hydroxysteroid dehydrogenase type 6 [Thamnophis sirtalis]|uniref:17-beta-hydroxysteroid dehydrogenase type 6 n=1 Tax=Thamnophis sirtalis TaxID=35019 RepID=A0A6I9XN09_9SAUR|nr:PREDICTED: 17-beta-hydroxysteroid dehydrogenase type 6 [Thamnophis sirtalis]